MSELRQIGDVLVSMQASQLETAGELLDAHGEVLAVYRQNRDAEGGFLRMAHLCLIAIERVRVMGESHAEHSGSGRVDSGARAEPGVVHRSSGWYARETERTAGGPGVSLPPH